MTAPTCHIVFSESGARVLQEALRESGRRDSVIWFPDDLGVGPINPPDPASRDEWVQREFGIDSGEWNWPIEDVDRFWDVTLSAASRRIVWVSRRVVWEYTGFLEFIRRAGDTPFDVVDLTETNSRRSNPPKHQILRDVGLTDFYNRLKTVEEFLANARPLTAAERDAYRALWDQLRQEDAALRTLTEHGLISVPLSYFDDLLVSRTIEQWRKVARVLSEALFETWESGFFRLARWCWRLASAPSPPRAASKAEAIFLESGSARSDCRNVILRPNRSPRPGPDHAPQAPEKRKDRPRLPPGSHGKISSAPARYPSRDSPARNRAGSWAGRRGRFPGA